MRGFLSIFGRDLPLVRRYLLLSLGLVAFTFIASHSLIALIAVMVPDQTHQFSASSAPPTTRTYTITRSVMDESITTGSIAKPGAVRIDPCKN
jgi:hypothetical protein